MSLSRSPTTVIPRLRRGMHRRVRQAIRRQLGAIQPAAGLFVVSATLLVVGDLTLGAVHHGTIQQADDTALVGVNRQNGMQEQAGMLAVAAIAEAVLAGLVVGEVQLGGVHDRQHVPAGGTPVGQLAGGGQHLVRRHRRVGQEAAELDRLIAILGQSVHAEGPFALHRRQQLTAHTG
jgi:hypothetical protein